MPIPLITAAIGTGGSLLSSFLSNRKGARTQTTTPTLDPELKGLQTGVISRINQRLGDPAAGTEGISINMKDAVNRRYENLPGRVSTFMARRGFGKSGTLGGALKGAETSRFRDLGNVDSLIARMVMGRDTENLGLAERLIASGRGSSTVGPGSAAGAGIGSGIESLMFMTLLDKILKGGGEFGGGVTPPYSSGFDIAPPDNSGLINSVIGN